MSYDNAIDFWKAQGLEHLGRYLRNDCHPFIKSTASNIHKVLDRHEHMVGHPITTVGEAFVQMAHLYESVDNRCRDLYKENERIREQLVVLESKLTESNAPDFAPTLTPRK